MTLSEFKAWFEGYTDAMGDKTPSVKQWAKIKDRISEIDGFVTSYPVYIDRYHPNWPYWNFQTTAGNYGAYAGTMGYAQNAGPSLASQCIADHYSPSTAMYALGKADAEGRAA